MNPTITDPCALKPTDLEAQAVLDDDGNPLRPHEPEPDDAWTERLRARFATVTRLLDRNTLPAMGVALAVGFVVGRALAGRSAR
jgi:hypothetical protein